MDDAGTGFVSSGFVAQATGASLTAVKNWDRRRLIVPSMRIEGSGRRVWRTSDLPVIQAQVAQLLRGNGRRRTAA